MDKDKDHIVSRVSTDRDRGASELAAMSLDMLSSYIKDVPAGSVQELDTKISTLSRELQHSRPGMAAVQNMLHFFQNRRAQCTSNRVSIFRKQLVQKLDDLINWSNQAAEQTVQAAKRLISPGAVIFTHSLSSTVRKTLLSGSDTPNLQIILTESRPLYEGQRLADEFDRNGIATLFITDAQMGIFIPRANFVLVGADTVFNDGTVVNKAGTLIAAAIAQHYAVPFYVCCETYKVGKRGKFTVEETEKSAQEVTKQQWDHVTVKNCYFDETPPEFISAWITEQGEITEPAEFEKTVNAQP